jgi:hypothetical protein
LDVYVNLRNWGKRVLLAICDADMLGKTLKQGKIVFHIQEKFYKGSLVSLEEAVNLIQQSTIVNMVGRSIVKRAIEEGLVHPDSVIEIKGVPHAQIVKL